MRLDVCSGMFTRKTPTFCQSLETFSSLLSSPISPSRNCAAALQVWAHRGRIYSVKLTRHCTPKRLLRRTSNLAPVSLPFSPASTPATPWTTAASDDGSNTRTSPEFISNECRWAIPGVWTWNVAVRPRLNKTTQLPSLQWSI